ncbi:MAG: hypothetical protein F7B95_00810 [Desulfurococcales archaeon]|nr:hypothetical protein [Desulfurococcales archaeon]
MIKQRLIAAFKELANIIHNLTIGVFKGIEEQSVEVLRLQYLELENAFLSIVMGGMVGLNAVPMGLAMELLPLLKDEIRIMESRHFLGSDVIADYFAAMGGEW